MHRFALSAKVHSETRQSPLRVRNKTTTKKSLPLLQAFGCTGLSSLLIRHNCEAQLFMNLQWAEFMKGITSMYFPFVEF